MFKDQKCSCGKVMDKVLSPPPECETIKDGFVKETMSFIICDDLSMMPNDFGAVVHLLRKLEVTNIGAIEEQTVDIGKKEAFSL
ncbi:hypothetical protein TSUD_162730 [Trifolium subterraneum]|uniref:Uncharacterized protein n=1 Tax=Trifolium subterraneum TaxID=3900 RepID=A0A2Z6MWK0_TRISU|nr:hypothetical protein TSUD_162730 [Trifolium subterraneum]